MRPLRYAAFHGPLAQLVEQGTLNPKVEGSIPSRPIAVQRAPTRIALVSVAPIPAAEFEERRERLLERVRQLGASGYVLFDADYIQYFTGFWFLSNERPVVYAQSAGGDAAIFVPEFEVARTRAETGFDRIESYPEYPGVEHPMTIFARVLADLGVAGAMAADQDGYPGILGYQGPPLSEVTGAAVSSVAGAIERMMARKSANEIALIRESGRWCAHAHRLLQEYKHILDAIRRVGP